MQALPAIASAAFSTPLVAASTGLALAGTAISTIGSMQEARYRSAVAGRQAILEEQNAAMVRQAGRVQAQDQDFEAAAIMSEELATVGSRGFLVNSTSYAQRRNNQAALARRDRLRTIADADNQAASAMNRAATSRMEGRQARRAGLFSVLSGGLDAGSSLIGGARLAGELSARRVGNQARTVN